ncbi:MAG TPA: BatD family protein, partial [Gammaproteobacteria bacterium]
MVNDRHCGAMLRSLLIACWLITAPAYAADISVQTDRAAIHLNESFTLTFSAQGSIDGDPDFSPLQQDFEIASTSQNSSFNIINGQAESSSSWVVTVFPKREGTLTIPPIRFGADESPELQIAVSADSAAATDENKQIFITVETAPEKPYVQAQTIVTVRLYRAVNMANENLSALEFSNNDVIVHSLDEGRNYKTTLSGRQYLVHERQYAIFPQQTGALTLKPLRYSGVSILSGRNFFDLDPFGSRLGGQPVRVQSEALTLDVQAPPVAIDPWLPASNLKLEEKWSGEPGEFQLGEPLTRKLRLTAQGLTAEQLPELPVVVSAGFKQYPDQPLLENRKNADSITGVREESVAFMPTRPGDYTLPAVEIKWWNTKTQKTEVAQLPARTVTVLAGENAAAAEQPPATEQMTAPTTGI